MRLLKTPFFALSKECKFSKSIVFSPASLKNLATGVVQSNPDGCEPGYNCLIGNFSYTNNNSRLIILNDSKITISNGSETNTSPGYTLNIFFVIPIVFLVAKRKQISKRILKK